MNDNDKPRWTTYGLNLNENNSLHREVIDRLRAMKARDRTMQDVLLELVTTALNIQPPADPIDERITELQSQIAAMGEMIRMLSERPIVQMTAGAPTPIDAIGESVVYDGSQDRVEIPLSDGFKESVVKVAAGRPGIGKATQQMEAPAEALRK